MRKLEFLSASKINKMEFEYPNFEEILELHTSIIEKSGGLDGVRAVGLLKSCLDFIKNDEYYPTFDDKITHLVFTIAKNHAFVDGNKRTAIGAGAYFLLINGFSSDISRLFIDKAECLILHVVQNDFTKEELKTIVSDYINGGELSRESLDIYKIKNIDPDEIPR